MFSRFFFGTLRKYNDRNGWDNGKKEMHSKLFVFWNSCINERTTSNLASCFRILGKFVVTVLIVLNSIGLSRFLILTNLELLWSTCWSETRLMLLLVCWTFNPDGPDGFKLRPIRDPEFFLFLSSNLLANGVAADGFLFASCWSKLDLYWSSPRNPRLLFDTNGVAPSLLLYKVEFYAV